MWGGQQRGKRAGPSRRKRTVCVVAWMRRRRKGEKGRRKDGKESQKETEEMRKDRWGSVGSARRKQVRARPRLQPLY